MYVHKTPPTSPQNTPSPGLNLKVGKMNYHLGNLDPNWAICLKTGPKFLEVGKKMLFIIPCQYMPIHSTIHTTIHTNTYHEIQYLPIRTHNFNDVLPTPGFYGGSSGGVFRWRMDSAAAWAADLLPNRQKRARVNQQLSIANLISKTKHFVSCTARCKCWMLENADVCS